MTVILMLFSFSFFSFADDFDGGYDIGHEDGYDEGYGDGYDDGYNDAVFEISDNDFKTVIENETDIAYSNGYTEGYNKGKKDATPAHTYDDGIQAGYKQATEEYKEEINNAVEEAKKDNIYSIITSICITAVISFFLSFVIIKKKRINEK